MNIIPELNLNKTPNTVKNGSIIGAKNIIVDDSGSYITNENGFKEVIELEHSNERIVGCIPCNEELVLFGYDDINSYIYRIDKNNNKYEIKHHWNYSGGIIVGDYTYNYKNELVICLGEYGVDNKKIPLKCWILPNTKIDNGVLTSEKDTYKDYKICPTIPKYNTDYIINDNGGNLICGRYTFYIRFKIYNDTYTNWFLISDDIFIVNLIEKTRPTLYYLIGGTKIEAAVNETFNNFYINNDEDYSNKSITLNLNFDFIADEDNHIIEYDEFQLGYIFKRESNTVGRIIGNYSTKLSQITIDTNNYIDEESIDEFIKVPKEFYNVQCVKVYNNRIYIANYEEDTIYDETSKCNTDIYLGYDTIDDKNIYPTNTNNEEGGGGENPDPGPEPTEQTINITFNIKLGRNVIVRTINNVPYEERDGKKYIINPFKIIYDNVTSKISCDVSGTSESFILTNSYENVKYDFDGPGVSVHETYDRIDMHPKIGTANTLHKRYIGNTKEYNLYNTGGKYAFDIIIEDDNTLTFKFYDGETKKITDNDGDCYFDSVGMAYQNGKGVATFSIHDTTGNITRHSSTTMNFSSKNSITCTIERYNSTRSNIEDTEAMAIADDFPIVNQYNKNYFNRTLLPVQIYSFYIHFIRNNGTITNGYKITSELANTEDSIDITYRKFDIIKNDNNELIGYKCIGGYHFNAPQLNGIGAIIVPYIKINKNSELRKKYIGYFISYEELENEVTPVYKYPTGTNPDYTGKRYNNSAYLYGIDSIYGSKLLEGNGRKSIFVADSIIKKLLSINNANIDKHVIMDVNKMYGTNLNIKTGTYIIYHDNTNIYNKIYKTLYRLTYNIYFDYNEDSYCRVRFLPSYFNKEILPYYTKAIVGTIASPEFYKAEIDDNSSILTTEATDFKIKLINEWNYSKYPYFALSIKQDYEQAMVNYVNYDAKDVKDQEIGLRYNNALIPNKIKDFLELKQCYIDKPNNSYTNYLNIYIDKFPKTIYRSDTYSDENLNNAFREFQIDNYKNITENKGSITNIVPIALNLIIHTEYSIFVFDRSPRLTSLTKTDIPDTFDVEYQELLTKSYGGLKDKRQSIITNFGYIWYDEVNKFIFRFDEGKLSLLSITINNFLKYLDIVDARFAFETIKNRLIISIKTNSYGIITLSYNFNTETFISLHDYYITNCYKTLVEDYIFNSDKANNKIFIYNSKEYDYKELNLLDDKIFDIYINNNKPNRYIDIVFNASYELPKVLEAIKYTLNNIDEDFDIISIKNSIEENLNKRFSGDKLLVYSNETNTGELNINCDDGHNKLNNYKYPFFDKGQWNLNYFRNTIKTDTKPTDSDNQSLIYGKYFVVRFIFNNDRRFKLETIEPNINIY